MQTIWKWVNNKPKSISEEVTLVDRKRALNSYKSFGVQLTLHLDYFRLQTVLCCVNIYLCSKLYFYWEGREEHSISRVRGTLIYCSWPHADCDKKFWFLKGHVCSYIFSDPILMVKKSYKYLRTYCFFANLLTRYKIQ